MRQWNRKQRIVLIAIAAVAAVLLLVAILTGLGRPKATQADPGGLSLSVSMPTPEPLPAPEITFTEDEAQPLIASGRRHALGEGYPIAGQIHANRPLTAVTVTISCAYNSNPLYPYHFTVTFPEGSNIYSYRLDSADTLEGLSLTEQLDLSVLVTGVHTLKIIASCEGLKSEELLRVRFYVLGDEWEQIVPEDFNDSYAEALAFFKETERFCYRYQWVNGRSILADPDWEETYITTIEGLPAGTEWRVHVDAVPYFEKALAYMDTTFVRVQGTNGDSGVVRLADLVAEYSGCYVSRFTSSLKTISHHGFGTAVDLNATMAPNLNEAENTAVIDDEVRNQLVYNGIATADGKSYYDYTYNGSYELLHCGVPETVLNYLLYELAFYRSGFLWAHYYQSTSDGMHFTLSEHVWGSHEAPDGLRKVYEYIDSPA